MCLSAKFNVGRARDHQIRPNSWTSNGMDITSCGVMTEYRLYRILELIYVLAGSRSLGVGSKIPVEVVEVAARVLLVLILLYWQCAYYIGRSLPRTTIGRWHLNHGGNMMVCLLLQMVCRRCVR